VWVSNLRLSLFPCVVPLHYLGLIVLFFPRFVFQTLPQSSTFISHDLGRSFEHCYVKNNEADATAAVPRQGQIKQDGATSVENSDSHNTTASCQQVRAQAAVLAEYFRLGKLGWKGGKGNASASASGAGARSGEADIDTSQTGRNQAAQPRPAPAPAFEFSLVLRKWSGLLPGMEFRCN
jgi:hypothetical protein